MFLLKIAVLFFLSLNIFASDNYIDSLTLTKIKKLVQKEEEIALAYKKYIFEKGTNKDDNTLITVEKLRNLNYLPKGFSLTDPFGRQLTIIANNKINAFTTTDATLKLNLYDYYYSNYYRTNTKAPLSINKGDIEIILSSDEKYKVEHKDMIALNKADAKNKVSGQGGYYLDEKGVLHWYDKDGKYKFSITNDLLVDQSVTVLNENGTITSSFLDLVQDKNFMYAGEKILRENDDSVDQYLNTNKNLVDLNPTKSVGKTVIRFSNSGGALIINGNIYTWGNNSKKSVSIGKNTYTNESGNIGSGNPIINTMVNTKAMIYDDTKTIPYTNNFNTKKFFSSPIRPNFIDLFTEDSHGTCGISLKSELYCGGQDILENNYISFDNYTKGSLLNMEYLYRSTFFNGITNKAKAIIALDNTYLVLSRGNTDTVDGYRLYYWGKDNNQGWAGTGNNTESNVFIPTVYSEIRFKDITYTLSPSYRKILGLDTEGNLFIWGLTSGTTCTNGDINYCRSTKIGSDANFTTIASGRENFLATDNSGNFYKISTAGVISKVEDIIKGYTSYNQTDDARILSVDFSRKVGELSQSSAGTGIVWVNSKNQLKGDYQISSGNDDLFENTILKIQWKEIKVIGDDNAMCGIDVNDQMYCWGNMVNSSGTGLILPLFNANLHDESKDYLLFEKTNSLTTMTSGDWVNNSKYYIKYPTYIGGFNYEFIFK
ncbi:hypothetical protein AVENP_0164 [Arcobacter venerupis]|uniref:Uncharacterized protein n=1 Tax=Arcobacter venerupis TaxID=1054033 RepID=A0AAE7B5L9_9BACT|nr:hypothetical protein [Arcobacter venerupis]QKF65744.1 hypothetical protein AVENP_0164 [Arcobacter venerupis]RWS50254.1 hypothetical protein CKA56_04785 [Arcobacter venerupis]